MNETKTLLGFQKSRQRTGAARESGRVSCTLVLGDLQNRVSVPVVPLCAHFIDEDAQQDGDDGNVCHYILPANVSICVIVRTSAGVYTNEPRRIRS